MSIYSLPKRNTPKTGSSSATDRSTVSHAQTTVGGSSGLPTALSPRSTRQRVRHLSDLPRYPDCGELARSNILMFGDGEWNPIRPHEQSLGWQAWRRDSPRLMVLGRGRGEQGEGGLTRPLPPAILQVKDRVRGIHTGILPRDRAISDKLIVALTI
jgi:hypothetical protein